MKNNRNLVCLCVLFSFGIRYGAMIRKKMKRNPEPFIEKTEKDIDENYKIYNFCKKCGYQSYKKEICPNCQKELTSPRKYNKTKEIEIHGNDLENLEYTYEEGLIHEEKYQELRQKILEKMKERKEDTDENANSEIEVIKRRQFREIEDKDLFRDGFQEIEEGEFETKEDDEEQKSLTEGENLKEENKNFNEKQMEIENQNLQKEKTLEIMKCQRCKSVNLTFYEGNMARCNDCKKVFLWK